MKNALVGLFGVTIVFGIGFATMVNGWGLQPVSWGWIIGGALSAALVSAVTQMAMKD